VQDPPGDYPQAGRDARHQPPRFSPRNVFSRQISTTIGALLGVVIDRGPAMGARHGLVVVVVVLPWLVLTRIVVIVVVSNDHPWLRRIQVRV
jgi:hypothetical protein